MILRVDIGVFAHNESEKIAAMVAGLSAQDILHHEGIDARILVLANGCTDDTVAIAKAAVRPGFEVVDLALGGKSRTWNRFVHDISRPEADILVFVDADIKLPSPDALSRLSKVLHDRDGVSVLNSQPVKDIVANPVGLTIVDRVIAAAAGGLGDWKSSVCGQLYAMPSRAARFIHLPIGLPVEDGFLRAVVLTDCFSSEEDFSRIDGLDGLSHIYESERSIGALIRHQIRIVIGSSVNTACFDWLRDLPASARRAALAKAARDDEWLGRLIRTSLPRLPFGYVPFHFLVKRLGQLGWSDLLRPKRIGITVLGFGFDSIVFVAAQLAMAFGLGAGFW